MQGVIDRFEGEMAVIETRGGQILVKRDELPGQAAEGDLLIKQGGVWMIDQAADALQKKKIKKLAEELWEDQDS